EQNRRRAMAEAERGGERATMGGAYAVLTIAYALSGQAAQGIESGQRAVKLLENTEDQSTVSYAYWALGLCHTQISEFQEALAAQGRALAIAETIGHPPLGVSPALCVA